MKTSKFSETQVCAILQEQEAGVKVADVARDSIVVILNRVFCLNSKRLHNSGNDLRDLGPAYVNNPG